MDLTNESYVIRISGKSFTEYYYKEGREWCKISSRGRKLKATAEQVLNHLLPALAGVKDVKVEVDHYESSGKRVLPVSAE